MPGKVLGHISSSLASETDELMSLTALLSSMGRQDIRRLLLDLVRDEETAAAIACRSSIHANGFVKIVLERSLGMTVRLHVWDTALVPDTDLPENIHDHVWAFASVVLVGELDEERFVENAAGMPADRYRYVRDRATLPPGKLERSGSVHLRKSAELVHEAGVPYRVDSSLLHRARNIRDHGLGATLAIMGVQRQPNASVFAAPDCAVRLDEEDAALSIDDTVRLVTLVADAI